MIFKEYPDREMLAIDLANDLAGALKNSLLLQEHVSFAVPGGTSPGPVFDTLCAADLDWARVHVMATDERWVPETDARSNAGLIRARLLTDRAEKATFLPFYTSGDSVEAGLPKVAQDLEPFLPISVLLLGMGADMHTASLFPDAPELAAALAPDAPVLLAQSPPAQPEPRISLSARVLDGALSKHLLITGAEKRAALERAQDLPPEQAPIQAVLSEMTVHWAA